MGCSLLSDTVLPALYTQCTSFAVPLYAPPRNNYHTVVHVQGSSLLFLCPHLLLTTNICNRYYYSHINWINITGCDVFKIAQVEDGRTTFKKPWMGFWSQKAGFLPSMPHCLHTLEMRYLKLRKLQQLGEDRQLTCWAEMTTQCVWQGTPSDIYH